MVQITNLKNEMSLHDALIESQLQQAQINLLKSKLRDVLDGFSVIEKCLSVSVKGDHADAPFPLNHKEAAIHHSACASAYQHALEMCNSKSLTDFVDNGFIEPALQATAELASKPI